MDDNYQGIQEELGQRHDGGNEEEKRGQEAFVRDYNKNAEQWTYNKGIYSCPKLDSNGGNKRTPGQVQCSGAFL